MLSIVIPVKNEKDNIGPLLAELAALEGVVPLGEVIYVDDGSTDGTLETLKSFQNQYGFLRVLRHDRTAGQSAALWTGVRAAAHEVVATLDGDGQNDPADIRLLYDCYQAQQAGTANRMVVGQRVKRQDNLIRKLSSRIANHIRASLLKDSTRDTGCGIKLFRRTDYLRLPYFNHMHRFLPALMTRDGVPVLHVDVSHRPRLRGVSKYGTLDRLWVGISDLFGVMWLQRRSYPALTVREE
ncbi:MAG: glycosyltransferase family 2 protein [Micavibrio sp.]